MGAVKSTSSWVRVFRLVDLFWAVELDHNQSSKNTRPPPRPRVYFKHIEEYFLPAGPGPGQHRENNI